VQLSLYRIPNKNRITDGGNVYKEAGIEAEACAALVYCPDYNENNTKIR